ncbi:MAG: hypothetical protein NTY38_27930 [Acidobacteria bacterium]|nr:hypothetical protein [Acidobacteriota bacterium]
MPAPEAGFTAFFVELRFPGPDTLPLVFTTEVVVTPDVYPFEAPAPEAKQQQHEPVRSLLR